MIVNIKILQAAVRLSSILIKAHCFINWLHVAILHFFMDSWNGMILATTTFYCSILNLCY